MSDGAPDVHNGAGAVERSELERGAGRDTAGIVVAILPIGIGGRGTEGLEILEFIEIGQRIARIELGSCRRHEASNGENKRIKGVHTAIVGLDGRMAKPSD